MNYLDIAKQIPAEYRKEILLTNMISRAKADASNPSAIYLFEVWKTYVEPDRHLDSTCGSCLQGILTNWFELQSTLVRIEKEANLLKNIST